MTVSPTASSALTVAFTDLRLIAVGESSVILLHPPLPGSVGISMWMERRMSAE